MVRHLALLALLGAGLHVHAAHAETTNCTNITSLPAVISSQGVYCLKQDLSTVISSGSAITINNNNVTLDCNDFKIGGLAAGRGTTATGISATNRLNITVRNCNVRGFRTGLAFSGADSGYHLIENSRFDLNTVYGLQVGGDGSTVRNVRVYDTGNAAAAYNAYGIATSGAVDILDNSINHVTASDNQFAFGIYAYANGGREVSHNRVSSVFAGGNGVKFGIKIDQSIGAIVRSNSISNLYGFLPGDIGIDCRGTGGSGMADDNIVTGYGDSTLSIKGCKNGTNLVD